MTSSGACSIKAEYQCGIMARTKTMVASANCANAEKLIRATVLLLMYLRTITNAMVWRIINVIKVSCPTYNDIKRSKTIDDKMYKPNANSARISTSLLMTNENDPERKGGKHVLSMATAVSGRAAPCLYARGPAAG